MARRDDEDRLYGVVAGSLRRWLAKARDVAMAPYRLYRMQPDPTAIYATQGDWNDEVDTILTAIGRIAMGAWSQATDVAPVSRHSFVQASLAQTENLLVRIPDEVYNLVFAELSDGINAGESLDQLAQRVDGVLTFTDSERWPNRARVIARTENTRAYGAGTTAAGMEQSRVSGRTLNKRWITEHDERVRLSHKAADGQTVPIWMPFIVEDEALMFPGDPAGSPDNVINCRCDVTIVNEEGRRG
jgi:hypothetical protein